MAKENGSSVATGQIANTAYPSVGLSRNPICTNAITKPVAGSCQLRSQHQMRTRLGSHGNARFDQSLIVLDLSGEGRQVKESDPHLTLACPLHNPIARYQ
jgi:hypothetical protein